MKGIFVSFEGAEGAGKSTQINNLADYLRKKNYDVLITREPGGTYIGEEIRRLVKEVRGEDAVCDETELLLFAASRAQIMRKVVLPHLEKGGVVLCDRFADSTTAYQGYGRGFDLKTINFMHSIATCGRFPDLTLLLDISPEDGFLRRKQREKEGSSIEDRLEAESLLFHAKVRNGFLEIAQKEPQRIKIINALNPREKIFTDILEIFLMRFKQCN